MKIEKEEEDKRKAIEKAKEEEERIKREVELAAKKEEERLAEERKKDPNYICKNNNNRMN